jgi:beta-galactosidase
VILKTTGPPTAIRLTPDRQEIRADINDLCYVRVEIEDHEGNRVPDASLPVSFNIEGEGKLLGIGNGNPRDMKSFQSRVVDTYRGRCLVILQPSGRTGFIRLTASGETLEGAAIEIKTR